MGAHGGSLLGRPPSPLTLELPNLQAGNLLEVTDVECGDCVIQAQRRRPYQQIFERDGDPASSLFTFYSSSEFRDVYGYRMHHHVSTKFFAEGPAAITVRFAGGAIDAVGQLDDGHDGECGINLSVCGPHPLKDLPHAFPATLSSD